MPEFEYMILSVTQERTDSDLEDALNVYGSVGWALVCSTTVLSGPALILVRPKAPRK